MIEVAESLIVKFGGGADTAALVKLELDGELNEGKTSFAPLDIINFRLHHDTSVQLFKMGATDGQVVSQGSGSRAVREELLFAEADDSHELEYLPAAPVGHGWFGNEADGLKRSGQREIVICGGELPALALVEYDVEFSLFKLLAPDVELAEDESYPITIVAYMEAA